MTAPITDEGKLLAEFPPVTTAEWKAAITHDLKGASYDEKLIWKTPEGIAVQPYYRAEDTEKLEWAAGAPGAFPFARGAHSASGWLIREAIGETDPAEANRAALAAIAAGAEEIALGGVAIGNSSDLALVLANLNEIPVHFAGCGAKLLRLLAEFLSKNPRSAQTSAAFDPLADLELAAEAISFSPAGFSPLAIDGAKFAARNIVEQIGLTLAAGADFMAAMSERGIDASRAASAVEFSFAIAENYFFEIAKLRAFRLLWARVVESFDGFGGSKQNAAARIAAITAIHEEPEAGRHMNMLRGTTEAMSAVLGGADSVTVTPFDANATEASRRLARNTQLLLKHEAFFARVADPGGGSYCLETITDELCGKAWKILQEIEAKGGFRKAETSLRG